MAPPRRDSLFTIDHDGEPPLPWWRDERKVIEAALELARSDPKAWRTLRNGVVKLAGDEQRRRELLGDLVELGKGRRGGAQEHPWREPLLVACVRVEQERGGTVDDGLRLAQQANPGLFPADLGALRNLYYRARRK